MKFSLLKLEWKKQVGLDGRCVLFSMSWFTVGCVELVKADVIRAKQHYFNNHDCARYDLFFERKKNTQTHTLYNIYKDVGIWTCVKKQSKVKCEQKHFFVVALFLCFYRRCLFTWAKRVTAIASSRVGRIWFSANADRTHGYSKKRNRTSFRVRSKIHHHRRNKTLL